MVSDDEAERRRQDALERARGAHRLSPRLARWNYWGAQLQLWVSCLQLLLTLAFAAVVVVVLVAIFL